MSSRTTSPWNITRCRGRFPYRGWSGMVPTFIRVYGFVWNIIFWPWWGYLWTNTSKNHGLVIRLPVCFTIFPTRGSYKLGCPPFLETPINNCGRCSLRVFFLIKFPHWLGTDLITMASLSSPRGKLDKIAYHWTSLPLLNHQNLIKFTKECNF